MKIYYINLECATDRREAIEKAFAQEDLVRIDAIDGMVWSDGKITKRPEWKPEVRNKFVEQKILDSKSQLPPTHLACNLSHKMAWDVFLKTKDDWCIVIEDDVEPTDILKGSKIEDVLKVPSGCGMFYLADERSLNGRLRMEDSGRVKRALTLAAYAINRRTAEIFIESLTPMMHLADFQLPICTFDGMQKWVGRHGLQRFESKRKVLACGKKTDGLICHSTHAKKSQLGNPSPG